MSFRPYKPTMMAREVVTQEMRVIVPPDEGAPVGSHRRVQILIPEEPKVYGAIDGDIELLGINRTYKLPTLAPGALLSFDLLPQQWIIAAAHERFAELTVIIEFREHA